MLERNWKFITILIVCIAIGMVIKPILISKYRISEKTDRLIRSILLVSPYVLAIILSNTRIISFQDIYNYIIPTVGFAGGWIFGKSNKSNRKDV